ncbi:MAG: hypothetical protein HXY35_14305 [Chloroflexi bacterium]|nr:hypothetical protein [Chloroflexota bacterium]
MSRNDSKGEVVLKTLLKVTTRELGEEMVFSSYKSLLGIAIRGGLQFALGPVGYVLPLADLIAWMTRLGAKTVVELYKSQAFGTSYRIRSGSSGILIAENDKPLTLRDFPVKLPEYMEIPRTDLFPAKPQSIDLNFYQLGAFGSPWMVCNECKQPLNSHAQWCSKNPNKPPIDLSTYRPPGACSECGQYFGHSNECSQNPNRPTFALSNNPSPWLCSECGWVLPGHAFGCSRIPNKPTFDFSYEPPPPCSECGQYYGHADGCSRNPSKSTIDLSTHRSPWACSECGEYFGHTDECSRNPNKLPPGFPYPQVTCDECGQVLPNHSFLCSKRKY